MPSQHCVGCHTYLDVQIGGHDWWPFFLLEAESQASLVGHEYNVEVERRQAIATHSCQSPLREWQEYTNALPALSWLPYIS